MVNKSINTHGISLIEVLVGATIVTLVLAGVVGTLQLYSVSSRLNLEKIQAALLLEEGVEAVRFMRDAGWTQNMTALSEEIPYYLEPIATGWEATTTQSLIDSQFYRTAVISSVYRRNTDDDIVDSASSEAKTLDPDTKKVVVTVTWGRGEASDVSFTTGVTEADLANFPSNDSGDGDPAQQFTTGNEAVRVLGVSLPLMRALGASPSDVYLEIRSDSTVGTVIATSTTLETISLPDSEALWTTFLFTSLPTLATSTSYYLRMRSIPDSTVAFSGSSGTLYWSYEQSVGSPYSGGDAYRYVGRQGDVNDTGEVLNQYDFSFRILTSDATRSLEAVTYLSNLFSN